MYFACRSWQWCICDTSSFWTNLFGNHMSVTAPAATRQKRIVNVLCKTATLAENRFPTVGHMSDIGRAQNSKAPVATRRRRRKLSYWQPNVETWQRPCFREVFHKDILVRCVLMRKYAKYVLGPKNMYLPHIFCNFCKNMKNMTNTRTGPGDPSGCSSYLSYFFTYF